MLPSSVGSLYWTDYLQKIYWRTISYYLFSVNSMDKPLKLYGNYFLCVLSPMEFELQFCKKPSISKKFWGWGLRIGLCHQIHLKENTLILLWQILLLTSFTYPIWKKRNTTIFQFGSYLARVIQFSVLDLLRMRICSFPSLEAKMCKVVSWGCLCDFLSYILYDISYLYKWELTITEKKMVLVLIDCCFDFEWFFC